MKTNTSYAPVLKEFIPNKTLSTSRNMALMWASLLTFCAICLIGAGDALAGGGAPDVAAPLDMLRTARTRAQASNLNVASATQGGTNVANIILIAMGVLGVGTASYSGYSLYNNIQQGEQARGSNATFTIAMIVGAMLTLIAVIIGVITNFVSAT